MIITYSGKYGDSFYQRTKGGKIQKKSLLIDWRSNHNPDNGVNKYRQLLKGAVLGKKFANRAEMVEAIKEAYRSV